MLLTPQFLPSAAELRAVFDDRYAVVCLLSGRRIHILYGTPHPPLTQRARGAATQPGRSKGDASGALRMGLLVGA